MSGSRPQQHRAQTTIRIASIPPPNRQAGSDPKRSVGDPQSARASFHSKFRARGFGRRGAVYPVAVGRGTGSGEKVGKGAFGSQRGAGDGRDGGSGFLLSHPKSSALKLGCWGTLRAAGKGQRLKAGLDRRGNRDCCEALLGSGCLWGGG